MVWRNTRLSNVAIGLGVDGKAGSQQKRISSELLIILIERSFTTPATLTKFARNTSPNPLHLHDVHFTAPWADALHLGFAEPVNLGPPDRQARITPKILLIRIVISV